MRTYKGYIVYGVLSLASLGALISPTHLSSANFSHVSDNLSSSRLSVAGRVDSTGTSAGSSNVKMKTSANAPFNTITTNNINAGDTITIGNGEYTVVTVIDNDEFTVDPVLLPGGAVDDAVIYIIQQPVHTITFDTVSAIPNGYFRVLLPADTTTPNDGAPDDQGFDFGGGSVTVTANDITGYDFVTGVATPAGGTGCTTPANYHCFEVHYSGAGAIGSTITITIGSGVNTPIAPAPGDTTEATAESYSYIIRNYNSSDTLVDNSSGKIALIEPVKVTATVDPIIEMSICGANTCTDVEPGDTVDGETLSTNTGATSTGTSVTLGTLSLSSARLQAQKITVATNASNGYVLTAVDDGDLSSGANTINDNVTPPTTPTVLNTPGTEAYGIHPCGTHVNAGTWGANSNSCTGVATTNAYSGTDITTPLTLVSYSTGPAASTPTFVTYKANISTTTAQGDYTHTISYTATGTF